MQEWWITDQWVRDEKTERSLVQGSFCDADAVFVDLGVSLWVAGLVFGDQFAWKVQYLVLGDVWKRNAFFVNTKKSPKVSSTDGCEMSSSWSEHGRIGCKILTVV